MLTLRTQKAIRLLHEIAAGDGEYLPERERETTDEEEEEILGSLSEKGIIRPRDRQDGTGGARRPREYRLERPLIQISLLDVLEALDEHLNCNHPATEEFYGRYCRMAPKLGVVNHMTRLYLEEIKMTEC